MHVLNYQLTCWLIVYGVEVVNELDIRYLTPTAQIIDFCPLQATPSASQWDETPGHAKGSETPGATPSTRMWDATPGAVITGQATPATPGKRNRWDATPQWGETPKVDGGGQCYIVCHMTR